MSSSNSNDDLSRPPSSVGQTDDDGGTGTGTKHKHIGAADHRRAGSASPASSSVDGQLDDEPAALGDHAGSKTKTDGKC